MQTVTPTITPTAHAQAVPTLAVRTPSGNAIDILVATAAAQVNKLNHSFVLVDNKPAAASRPVATPPPKPRVKKPVKQPIKKRVKKPIRGGGLVADQARAWVDALRQQKRYRRDVY